MQFYPRKTTKYFGSKIIKGTSWKLRHGIWKEDIFVVKCAQKFLYTEHWKILLIDRDKNVSLIYLQCAPWVSFNIYLLENESDLKYFTLNGRDPHVLSPHEYKQGLSTVLWRQWKGLDWTSLGVNLALMNFKCSKLDIYTREPTLRARRHSIFTKKNLQIIF